MSLYIIGYTIIQKYKLNTRHISRRTRQARFLFDRHTLVAHLAKLCRVKCELLGFARRLSAKIVCSGLQTLLPRVVKHACNLVRRWGSEEQIHTLRLTNVATTVSRHIYNDLLTRFPHRFVQVFDGRRNGFRVLHRPFVEDDFVFETR